MAEFLEILIRPVIFKIQKTGSIEQKQLLNHLAIVNTEAAKYKPGHWALTEWRKMYHHEHTGMYSSFSKAQRS